MTVQATIFGFTHGETHDPGEVSNLASSRSAQQARSKTRPRPKRPKAFRWRPDETRRDAAATGRHCSASVIKRRSREAVFLTASARASYHSPRLTGTVAQRQVRVWTALSQATTSGESPSLGTDIDVRCSPASLSFSLRIEAAVQVRTCKYDRRRKLVTNTKRLKVEQACGQPANDGEGEVASSEQRRHARALEQCSFQTMLDGPAWEALDCSCAFPRF